MSREYQGTDIKEISCSCPSKMPESLPPSALKIEVLKAVACHAGAAQEVDTFHVAVDARELRLYLRIDMALRLFARELTALELRYGAIPTHRLP